MVKGSKEKKLNAMKDLSTGSAGVVAIVFIFDWLGCHNFTYEWI